MGITKSTLASLLVKLFDLFNTKQNLNFLLISN